jgi:glycosyltransferase involved in cell wall biosynthesis
VNSLKLQKPDNLIITVITATYNCAKTLPVCLKSIAQQSYSNVEHIVIDGDSTDETIDIVYKNINKITVFQSEKDSGIYDALNKGIALATGDVVGFLHADDFFASRSVLSLVAAAFEDPSVCAVYGDLQYVSKRDISKVVRKWQSNTFKPGDLALGWMPAHPTLYIRREWYQKIGGFDVNYKISADYLSILRLFSQTNFKAVYLPHVLITMRLGGVSNKSAKAILNKSIEDWRALRSCGYGKFIALQALVWKNFSKFRQFL